ncbi:hypothetical protein [Paraburkholderia sartisoli]|uniref:Uncharacterized protein n=1 Tax=Paraburkholderia sartisoli TaxID=83784 RepID=A0A1H3XWQ7_9BURK|nr:hypothetical protein [Paraburkholderia sartisoli]SEA02948.1 hypothetical protein SAMN05192564_10116 [Paraburkholderia sartisoli]
MWKTRVVAVMLGAASFMAQTHAEAQQRPAQQSVQWQLQVVSDGQQIDAFDGTTTVGQARTDTHHHVVTHNVGCKDAPGGSIDLLRTLTVSPLQASATEVTLTIEAQETIEEPGARETDTGCKLPPQPRRVAASHPGLTVPDGQWVTWTIVDKNPTLVYRVKASLATQP